MTGSFRHLMVYVSDLERSTTFHDRVLGFLGYAFAHSGDTYAVWNPSRAGYSFGIVLADSTMRDDRHIRGRAGVHHLALNAECREQIDALYDVLQEIEAVVLDPPVACPEYSPTYCAVYYEDPDGMKLEVAHY
ncbi:TPA: bleomycin resistance protein [Candidatus Latescibacteria bacterium]|nr:bleomycin resistance protein [Candidatus Latescibacterota bacterium]